MNTHSPNLGVCIECHIVIQTKLIWFHCPICNALNDYASAKERYHKLPLPLREKVEKERNEKVEKKEEVKKMSKVVINNVEVDEAAILAAGYQKIPVSSISSVGGVFNGVRWCIERHFDKAYFRYTLDGLTCHADKPGSTLRKDHFVYSEADLLGLSDLFKDAAEKLF